LQAWLKTASPALASPPAAAKFEDNIPATRMNAVMISFMPTLILKIILLFSLAQSAGRREKRRHSCGMSHFHREKGIRLHPLQQTDVNVETAEE
jgi:hypothetical protein